MKTGDLLLMKKINQSIVLDSIRKHSPISRAAIAQQTGLTRATVSSQVQELLDSRLAEEIGVGTSSGGRKPVLLTFNQKAGYAIGIDLGVTQINAVLTDLSGSVIERTSYSFTNTEVEHVIDLLVKCIRDLTLVTPESPYGVIGIGIGVPGIYRQDGMLLMAPNLGWVEVPLKEILEAKIALPVTIDNEANAGALGEKEYGAGKTYTNQIYVSLGMGIGTGIILNNQLYRGTNGYSGEMGHTTIDLNGRVCRCGNTGCWEMYASESAMLKAAADNPDAWLPTAPPEDMESFAAAVRNGHAAVGPILYSTGKYLAVGLVNMIHTFNPELVIIGSKYPEISRALTPSMQDEFSKRLLSYHDERLLLQFSSLGADATMLGAATLAISRFFSDFTVKVE